MSHTTSLDTSAFARTAALTTILALGAASAAQAVAPALPARVVQPSAQYKFSHLAAFHTPVRSAATHGATSAYPLNAPDGLAVAPNGDLYVANLLANQVLVYGSNLAQKTAGTISTGLAHPSSVAFDSASEVFVSNIASNQITVYAPNHMPLTNRTITSSVNAPVSIAIDGFDNLYVDDNFAAVGLYSYTGAFLGNIPLTTTLLTLNSIAQHGHLSAFAGTNQVQSCVSAQAIDYVVHGYGFGSPTSLRTTHSAWPSTATTTSTSQPQIRKSRYSMRPPRQARYWRNYPLFLKRSRSTPSTIISSCPTCTITRSQYITAGGSC